MLRTEDLFGDHQGALEQRLGLRQPPLVHVQSGQVVEASGDGWMTRTESPFVNHQGALKQRLGINDEIDSRG